MYKLKQPVTFFDGHKAISAWNLDSMEGWTSLEGDDRTTVDPIYYYRVPWLHRAVKDRANLVSTMPFSILKGETEVDTSQNYQNKLGIMPDYKVLFFHSLGVSRSDPTVLKYKLKWKDYMETLLVKNWKQCVDLLDHYDCVGTEYIPVATYKEETIQFEAPHYQGFFWWANTNYLKKLDPTYFYQDVEWQPYLCELWIGSGKPKAYNFYTSWLNHYMHEINPPYEEILNSSTQHLKELNNEL
jgi:hypothetical protein